MKTLKNTVGTVKIPIFNKLVIYDKKNYNGRYAPGPSEGLFDDRIERSV